MLDNSSAGHKSKNCDLSVFQNNFLQLHFIHTCLWSAGLTSVIIMDVQPFLNSAPFLDMLHSVTQSTYTSLTWWWILLEKAYFGHKTDHTTKFICGAEFPVFLHLHIKLSPEKHLPDSYIIYWMFTMLQGLPKLWGTEPYLLNVPFVSQKQTKKGMIQCDYRKIGKYKGKSECKVFPFYSYQTNDHSQMLLYHVGTWSHHKATCTWPVQKMQCQYSLSWKMVTLLNKWTRDEVWAQNIESMNIQRHAVAVYVVHLMSVQQVQKWCHDFANG